MSNRVTIEPTKFTNVRTGDTSYGFRIYDEYDSDYNDSWKEIPDDDIRVIRLVFQSGNTTATSILSYIVENELGIYIGDSWYEWDEIKEVLLNCTCCNCTNITKGANR